MIYIIKDKKKWDYYFKKSRLNTLQYSKKFVDLFYDNAKLLVIKKGKNIALLCYMVENNHLKSIRYGGIFLNENNEEFKLKSKNSFLDFLNKNNIRSYSIRAHPFLDTIKIGKKIKKELFVFIDLTRSKTNLERDISRNHQRSIKKSEKYNLRMFETRKKEDIGLFYSAYKDLCKKKKINAKKRAFFKELFDSLENNISLVCVEYRKEIIARSIIFKDNDDAYMMFGTMTEEGYLKCAKHFMIKQLILKYKEKGYQRLVLGGGNKDKDSIYKFKKGFTNKENHIYTYGGEM